MSEMVEVTKSESGQWWRMRYRGKVEFCEDEPGDAQRKLFKESVDARVKEAEIAQRIGAGRNHTTVTQATR